MNTAMIKHPSRKNKGLMNSEKGLSCGVDHLGSHLKLKNARGLMINRILNLIFIDFFALTINATLGTVLRSKICNYSWEGEYQAKNQKSNESPSTDLLQQQEDTKM
jgi:hypothetical protein